MDGLDTGGFVGDQPGMGQGLSYVLPQSRTVGYFMQLANEMAQQNRDDAAAAAAAQQKQNELYAQRLYNEKTPQVASEFTKALQPKFDAHLQNMVNYHATTGQDPYSNPDLIKERNDNQALADSTQGLHTHAIALGTALADKSKNYTPESAKAVQSALNEYGENPTAYLPSMGGKLFPQLQQRDMDMNDATKLGHPVPLVSQSNGYTITAPNTHSHIVQGQQILTQPEFAPLMQKKYGVDPNVGDVFGQPSPTGGTIYPTDAPTVNAIADHILQNAAQPHYAATLQAAGIDPTDPHAKDKLTELATKQNLGYGRALTDFSKNLDAKVEQKKVRDYGEERLGISEANLTLAQQRLALQQEKEAKKGNTNNATQPLPDFSIPYNTNAEDNGFPLHAKNFVPLATAGKEFAGTPDIDVANGGKTTGPATSIQGKIAGVGDFPVFKSDGTPVQQQYVGKPNTAYRRMVLIEDKDGQHYLLDYNKLPANTKNSKPIREALGIFDKTPVGGDSPDDAQPIQQLPKQNKPIKGTKQSIW